MPATDYYGGSFLGRISIRRNQVVSMDDGSHHHQQPDDLDVFQKNVAQRFAHLLPASSSSSDIDTGTTENVSTGGGGNVMLSIAWLRKLLDIFLCCEAEFKAVLIMGRDPSHLSKAPLDRLVPELLERSVKGLDICNAISNGIELLRHLQKLAEIVVSALEMKPFGDGQVRRAQKALRSLLNSINFDEKEPTNSFSCKSTERTWSYSRRFGASVGAGAGVGVGNNRSAINLRTVSFGVSKNWSAAKQIQAMTCNLVAPRGNESSGLALPVYVMSSVMVFVMWVLVAAIPCQERNGLTPHFPVPRQLGWAQGMIEVQEKISEEWKKKEKKGSSGLMEEIQRMEKICQNLMEFTGSFRFPLEAEKEDEVVGMVGELGEICRRMEEGLVPLQLQIREVFHRIVRSRAEVLELVDHSRKSFVSIM